MNNGFFKGFKEGFREFGNVIINIINFVLLFFVYFIGVGLTSIIAKITGKHFLKLKSKNNVDSYWCRENIPKNEKGEFYRQF